MPEENKDHNKDFSDRIRKIIEQAIKSGNFPKNGIFSIKIEEGKIPYEIKSPETDKSKNMLKLNNPHTEIHRSENKILVYINIPGCEISDTAVAVHEDIIIITSITGEIRHRAEIKIPAIRKETMKYQVKNGVFEISALAAE